jgi:hypothetical protein
MNRQIGLTVAVEVQAFGRNPPFNRRLMDGGSNAIIPPLDLTGNADIDRQHLHGQAFLTRKKWRGTATAGSLSRAVATLGRRREFREELID